MVARAPPRHIGPRIRMRRRVRPSCRCFCESLCGTDAYQHTVVPGVAHGFAVRVFAVIGDALGAAPPPLLPGSSRQRMPSTGEVEFDDTADDGREGSVVSVEEVRDRVLMGTAPDCHPCVPLPHPLAASDHYCVRSALVGCHRVCVEEITGVTTSVLRWFFLCVRVCVCVHNRNTGSTSGCGITPGERF